MGRMILADEDEILRFAQDDMGRGWHEEGI